MNNKLVNNMISNGYTAIINSIDKTLIKKAQENINETLKKILLSKKLSVSKKLIVNLLNCLKIYSHYQIQILAAQNLTQSKITYNMLRSKKILNFFTSLFGPDLEYMYNNELSINVRGVKDDYLVKKYHQHLF